ADDAGQTAYQLAVLLDRTDVAELLLQHGADSTLGEFENWVQGALNGTPSKEKPDWQSIGRSQKDILNRFAGDGRTEQVLRLLDAGFPIELGLWAPPLHNACWNGKLETVRALLHRKAPLEIKDPTSHATPVGWTMHGSVNCRKGKPEDYVAILQS